MSASPPFDSRESSPTTPESSSDSAPSDTFPQDFGDLSVWCHSFPDSDPTLGVWEQPQNKVSIQNIDPAIMAFPEQFLSDPNFDAVSPESLSAIDPSVFQTPQSTFPSENLANMPLFSPAEDHVSIDQSGNVASAPTPSMNYLPQTITPPKMDVPQSIRRVVLPDKESCYNLCIVTPNIPAHGTKSRVETQVRVIVDLAYASSSAGNPVKYDRVGSWNWLKLPKGTTTKRRSRKDVKINAPPEETLYLDAEVRCSSPPHMKVVSCATCQGREAKRVARKIAARVRPSRSDSENEEASPDKGNVIQFNCLDTLDFSKGSIALPLRITCYCRHHREKVGFNVHFTMTDHTGRIVGKGITPPIMITDDHKSTNNTHKPVQVQTPPPIPSNIPDFDSEPKSGSPAGNYPQSPRHRQYSKDNSTINRRRTKPYDNARVSVVARASRSPLEEESIDYPYPIVASALDIDSALSAFLPTNESLPGPTVYPNTAPPSPSPQMKFEDAEPILPSPPQSFGSPASPMSNFLEGSDILMVDPALQSQPFMPLSPPRTAPPSPPTSNLTPSIAIPSNTIIVPPLSYPLVQSIPPPTQPMLPMPKINRLIPSSGPTFGGIEVIVLGSNFLPSVMYNCVFGDTVASSTARWSENTLVCTLPARASPGVVPVTLEGITNQDQMTTALFTYVDESDRNLMELALQVVGLKMTGKLEDAKNVAIRIVGSSNADNHQAMETGQMMHMAASTVDTRRLLLSRATDSNFEKLIVDLLSVMDVPVESTNSIPVGSAVSHPTSSGQTLLHLAVHLKFTSVVEFLVQHQVDVDARDNNGSTALHFAALVSSYECARLLLDAGADICIVDALGRTPAEVGPQNFFDSLDSRHNGNDDEDQWGDAEDEENAPSSRSHSAQRSRRRHRHPSSRQTSRPASVSSHRSDRVLSGGDQSDLDDGATVVAPEPQASAVKNTDCVDEKQAAAASFAEMLQRAWAMPPFPQLRAGTAWVYPIIIPMPAWAPFRSPNHEAKVDRDEKDADSNGELRTFGEKLFRQLNAKALRRNKLPPSELDSQSSQVEHLEEDEMDQNVSRATSSSVSLQRRSKSFRRLGHSSVPNTAQPATGYTKAITRTRKQDIMLHYFWIPILICAIIWALFNYVPMIISTFKEILPMKGIRLPILY